jgi:hypothetical protein
MRLMTANMAGTIQAAETIIQGRKRGTRTVSQYRWSSTHATPINEVVTVRVTRGAARVLIIVS